MKQSMKRAMALLATGVLILGLLAPVTRISAADKNKAAEIPVNFTNSSWEDEWKFAGCAEIPAAELHPDASFTTWNEENEKDVPIDYAEAKKTGDFYVITYKNTTGSLHTEDAQSDVSKAERLPSLSKQMERQLR